jgi:simple sugar transport system permease protein
MNLAIWLAGASPSHVWSLVVRGTFGNAYGIGQSLAKATPLALTGLSVAFAFRAGLFNIGAEGQLGVGILAAAVVGARIPPGAPRIVAVLVVAIAAMASGGLLGAVPGYLRGRFGAHEVITTLMLNGLVAVLTTWLYGGPLRVGDQVHTRDVVAAARVPMLGEWIPALRGTALSAVILVAIAAPFAADWWLRRTWAGLRVRSVGSNPEAARALGVSISDTFTRTMAVSGAFAGLAGVHYVLGAKGFAEEGLGAGVGFTGIAVAMLGRGRAGGILAAAVLLGALSVGGLVINAIVPADIVAVGEALALVAVAAVAAVPAANTRTGGS